MIKIYTDGGSRGNPGPSACGYVILDDGGKELAHGGKYLGLTTNSHAEYLGAVEGLRAAIKLGCKEVTLFMDSLMVVNQLKGRYEVKNRDLWSAHESTKKMITSFATFKAVHIPREKNKAADSIVNEVLDSQSGK